MHALFKLRWPVRLVCFCIVYSNCFVLIIFSHILSLYPKVPLTWSLRVNPQCCSRLRRLTIVNLWTPFFCMMTLAKMLERCSFLTSYFMSSISWMVTLLEKVRKFCFNYLYLYYRLKKFFLAVRFCLVLFWIFGKLSFLQFI